MRRGIAMLTVAACLLLGLRANAEESKLIALTFDDGPGIYTERLLEGLAERNAKATFFILGCNAERFPDTVAAAYRQGHQIANHTYSHDLLTGDSQQQVGEQLKKTEKILNDICQKETDFLFRPPFGEYSEQILSMADCPVISWTVDPLDWKVKDAKRVTEQITQNAYDGAIVLSHDIYASTVEGVLAAVDCLQKEGYEFVTVNELFRRRGVPMREGKVYCQCRPTGVQLPAISKPEITVQTAANGTIIAISADENAKIYFTTDGSQPTVQSEIYSEPFAVSQDCTITAVAVYRFNGGRSELASAEIAS